MTLGWTGFSGKTQVVVSVVVILVIIVISNIIVTHHNIKHTGTEGSVDYGCGGRGEESGGGGDGGKRMGVMYGRGRRVCGGIITYIAILTQACFQDCPGQPGISSAQDHRARSNEINHRKHSKLVTPNASTDRIVGADGKF